LNLIRSHATGIGNNLPLEACRRIHALRINTLAKGYSGISNETLNDLIFLFNSGCVPKIPQSGTVGASGDLVPLSHIALALIGEGELWNPKTEEYEYARGCFKHIWTEESKVTGQRWTFIDKWNIVYMWSGFNALE